MTFKIGRNTSFVDATGAVKNLADELGKIGAGGGSVDLSGYALLNHNHDATYLKLGGGTLSGVTTLADGAHIVPANANMTDLGSANKPFRDVYVGPNTLYVNGNPVLSSSGTTLDISTSVDEHLSVNTSGLGTTRIASGKEVILYSGSLINLQSVGNIAATTDGDFSVSSKKRISLTSLDGGQNILLETKDVLGTAHINLKSTGQINLTSTNITFSSKPTVSGSAVLTAADSSSFAAAGHNHDAAYAAIGHNHDSAYAATNHNHNGTYAAAAHNHDTSYVKQDGSTAITGAQKVRSVQITNASNVAQYEFILNATTGTLDLKYVGA